MKALLFGAALIAMGAARAEAMVSVNDTGVVLCNGATVGVSDSAPDGRLRVVGRQPVPGGPAAIRAVGG